MSSTLSSTEKGDHEVYRQDDEQAERETTSTGSADNISLHEAGLRGKFRRFWKRTRIPTVVKKVVAGSKTLLSRLAATLKPDATPPEPQSEETNVAPRVERVKFPEDMISSPASSSNIASRSGSSEAPDLDISLPASAQTSPPIPCPSLKQNSNGLTTREKSILSECRNDFSSGGFRYKEKKGKPTRFPEIQLGVVACRVKWLELLLSGEKADDKNSSPKGDGALGDDFGSEEEAIPHALEIHARSELGAGVQDAEEVPTIPESDQESVFDDSPRLFRHRLPEEEPRPWVEPGTVARGARWLQPVMSGEKRTESADSVTGNPMSPTRISLADFH